MSEPLLRLLPGPAEPRPLEGTYLEPELPRRGALGPYLYANFVQSLDGRISLAGEHGQQVPGSIGNPRDWRLLQELAGQAGVLLSSGRYLRQLSAGSAQDVLPVGEGEAFADIRERRRARGLAPQPDVAVLSASLDFPVPRVLLEQGRRVLVLCGESPDPGRRRTLEAAGLELCPVPGGPRPGGDGLRRVLAGLGYERIYGVTGPYVVHALLAAGLIDSLFLTTVHRVLGGSDFTTICEGEPLAAPADFRLASLYHDPAGPGGCSQAFARYDRLPAGDGVD